ncbi:sodium/calcium exchanger 1-like isoform X3 [Petromyzon marinus]|uniref:sodium/calcium exchanger 1-like isoform X3 n=1 Tax=Petromyzon marinus TaxID=7757 RepID=UPI003F701AC5
MGGLRLRGLARGGLQLGLAAVALLIALSGAGAATTAAGPPAGPTSSPGGATATTATANQSQSCLGTYTCMSGILLPIWLPNDPPLPDKVARALVYFVCLMYMFLGVSIIADRFMSSIEVITSQEKEITIKKPSGETVTTTVRVWNETVSNLTLMALGSSAPEILLSVIEVCGHHFEAGALGPSTIVGSAAFNMFVIIAICVYVVPDGETRRIKHLRVFFVTTAWSVFAYIWLYLILAVFSEGIVEVWEALLTLAFFPVCVVFAWVADRRLLFYKYVYKRYRADKRRCVIVESEGERPKSSIEMDGKGAATAAGGGATAVALQLDGPDVADEPEAGEGRREMFRILKELKHKHPDKDLEQLTEMANYQLLSQQQKSRAFYRIQATRKMTGAGNILKKHLLEQARRSASITEIHVEAGDGAGAASACRVFFEPSSYRCLESCGACTLTVVRRGGDPRATLYVDYRTEDGTASAGSDYDLASGTLVFRPGETEKTISVGIVDDDIFEEDEQFFVRLSNLRAAPGAGDEEGAAEAGRPDAVAAAAVAPCLATPDVASVTILDDDHAGLFGFEEAAVRVSESVGCVEVRVVRCSGARGSVLVPFASVEGRAKGGGEDYEDVSGELLFKNEESVKTIQIRIVDDEEYEKNKSFFLELGEPRMGDVSDKKDGLSAEESEARRVAALGKPGLGEHRRLEIIIEESYEFKSTVDRLIKKTNLALVVGTHSWREQFVEAVTVGSGDDDDDDGGGGEERMPSCCDYIMHFLTVFWKVLFACVPPTEYWNGWACFVVSISVIGVLTAVIGDLASHFGCTVGLKDSVNAVVFVALGTSVPDTFASKVAAVQDQYADASIGNVTGSNAVNVFLGIGIAWSIAAIYWWTKDEPFRVQAGTLAFSVTLFTIFAFISVAVLMLRRRPSIGGELGGPRRQKLLTCALFVLLWLIYILFSGLEAYCHIPGF